MENIKLLHDLTISDDEKNLPKLQLPPHKGIKSFNPNKDYGNISVTPQKGTGITNIKISGDWTVAYLYIGAHLIDTIYKCFGMDSFYVTNEGRYIYGEFANVEVKANGNKTITYDVVEIDSDDTMSFIKQNQINDYTYKKRIPNYQHYFIDKIQIHASTPISSLMLSFEGAKFTQMPFTKISDSESGSVWELNLGLPISFTRLEYRHNIKTYFDADVEAPMVIISTYHNVLIATHGITRVKYAT